MTMTAARVSLEELLRPERESVEALDRIYESALRTGETAEIDRARTAYLAAKRVYRRAEQAAFADGLYWTCGRCGGSGTYLHYGTCFNCGGSGFHGAQTPHKFDADPRTRLKREAKAAAERRAEQARIKTSLAALPGPVTAALTAARDRYMSLNGYYDPGSGEEMSREEVFLHGLYEKLAKYGTLTDGQITAVERGLERAAQRAADDAAVQSADPLPTGRYEITGEILSTKLQSSSYGSTLKMLVKRDDGTKVWGSVPAALEDRTFHGAHGEAPEIEDLRGLRIRFTATVERSDNDPHFGFFKRPTTPEVIS